MAKNTLLASFLFLALGILWPSYVHADGDVSRIHHIIIVMQENHSFDNYFGALPYAPGTPYKNGPCDHSDHRCVDGLSCQRNPVKGTYRCNNSNRDDVEGENLPAFHAGDYCVRTDLDHEWIGTHMEANFFHPNDTLAQILDDGFVRQNDLTSQPDTGVETSIDDETMSFYDEQDLGFYYSLAETFAIDDRYFCSVLGPTFPNRSYLMAATSFGHLSSNEIVPDIRKAPALFYQPITGTIFDLLDAGKVSWVDYFKDIPQGISFRNFLIDPHFRLFSKPSPYPALSKFNKPNSFLNDAKAGTLPAVAIVDAASGFFNPADEDDEHPGPGSDIRAGQSFAARVVSAVRKGPNWKDSIIFITYDEHGGFYDHVPSPPAAQGGALNPDRINPGQCADLSNPSASENPHGGLNCAASTLAEQSFCPGFTPTGAFPAQCVNFNQLGIRVPLIAVSPFSKQHYVSHTVGDHTSLLALIERRFLSGDKTHLTERDAHANTLEDLFDFDHSPSLDAPINPSLAIPASPSDPGCAKWLRSVSTPIKFVFVNREQSPVTRQQK
jgi:phospholipase C